MTNLTIDRSKLKAGYELRDLANRSFIIVKASDKSGSLTVLRTQLQPGLPAISPYRLDFIDQMDFDAIGEDGKLVEILNCAEVREAWPNNGIEFNRWYKYHAQFIACLKLLDTSWTKAWRFKYLNYRVDTRTDTFRVYDRDGEEVSPTDVLHAMQL